MSFEEENLIINELFNEYFKNSSEWYNCLQISKMSGDRNNVLSLNIIPGPDHSYFDQNNVYKHAGELKLIHYTSLKALLSIISERSIRMYTLDNTNDTNEIRYAAEKIANKGCDIESMLKHVYSFSACKYQGVEKLDIWRYYGIDGNGVGIIISVDETNINEWKCFNISPILYGDKKLKYLNKLKIKIYEFNKKLQLTLGHTVEINLLLERLYSLHKKAFFSYESEVRMCFSREEGCLFTLDVDSFEFPTIKPDINRFNKKVYYVEFPILGNKDNEPFLQYLPKIKIEGITLGYKYDEKNLEIIKEVINELSIIKLGYSIDNIKLSTLRNQIN